MQQYKQTEENENADSLDGHEKDVVDIAKYKSSEDSEVSAFEQVMSQMNIADRSAFDEKFAQLWQESSDENKLLSVMICEIDFFKAYNENYGHQGASFMLLVIGLALKKTCEEQGCFLARYENEEFAILMKGGNEEKALAVAESLRKAVESSKTEHKYSSVSSIVTLSIGVSSVYPNSMDILMSEADSALHEAKTTGRNKVSGNFPHKNESSLLNHILENEQSVQKVVAKKDKDIVKEAKSKKSDDTETQKAPVSNTQSDDFKKILLDMNVADRSSFHENFVKLWDDCTKEKELLSMLMCEVDFFKAYTDNYGSAASEDVLLIVASALQSICAEHDCFVAHVEGEKFIVLAKGGNATNALKIAQSLHKSVKESETENSHSDVSDIVTMSIGLSSLFPSDLNSMKSLMIETNTALHAAITSGRNQISVH